MIVRVDADIEAALGEACRRIEEHRAGLGEAARSAAEHLAAIGQILAEVREGLRNHRGRWSRFLRDHQSGLSPRDVRYAISFWERFGQDLERLGSVTSPTALKLLTNSRLTAADIDRLLEEATRGEKLTVAKIRRRLKEHRTDPPGPPEENAHEPDMPPAAPREAGDQLDDLRRALAASKARVAYLEEQLPPRIAPGLKRKLTKIGRTPVDTASPEAQLASWQRRCQGYQELLHRFRLIMKVLLEQLVGIAGCPERCERSHLPTCERSSALAVDCWLEWAKEQSGVEGVISLNEG